MHPYSERSLFIGERLLQIVGDSKIQNYCLYLSKVSRLSVIIPKFFKRYILWKRAKYFIEPLMSLQIFKDLQIKKNYQYFIYNLVSLDYK